jgi:ribonuclease HI
MIRDSKLIIFTDGGARGNPGPAALGVVIYDSAGKIIKKFGKFLGERTNNEAEYEAVISGLESAKNLGAAQIEFNLDSNLLVRQLNNIYRVKNHRMQELVLRVRNLEAGFKKIKYRHVPREKNQLADELVNKAIDKGHKN